MFERLFKEESKLVFAGISFLAMAGLFVVLWSIDSYEIQGINRWIKPFKFATSMAIYVFTLVPLLAFLNANKRSKDYVRWIAISTMWIELLLLTMQAARGTRSHFNSDTAFDISVYAAMGTLIAINTIAVGYLGYLWLEKDQPVSVPVLWGIRLGILIFVVGSLQAGYMAAQTGHAIGAADGGPGLPLLNWSTTVGDLRVAHFLALHSLQAVPLFGLTVSWFSRERIGVLAVFFFAMVYFAAFLMTFLQALGATPLLRFGI